jgi:hypothetical protein
MMTVLAIVVVPIALGLCMPDVIAAVRERVRRLKGRGDA